MAKLDWAEVEHPRRLDRKRFSPEGTGCGGMKSLNRGRGQKNLVLGASSLTRWPGVGDRRRVDILPA
jgi:hypothetical protein